MDLRIRTISEDEFAHYARALGSAFSEVLSDEELARERRLAELDRCFAAFDGDDIVGTAAAITMPMAVPGWVLDVGYVTAVGVRPTHRRRGINTELMRRQLEDAHERGEAVAVLYASEGQIYGRYGYGLATLGLSIDVESGRSAFVRGYEPSGSTRFVEGEGAVGEVLAVHEAAWSSRPGMVKLDAVRLDYLLHEHGPDRDAPRFFVVHRGDRGPDGYAIYRVRHDWEGGVPRSVLTVLDLQAVTTGGHADLWRFVFDVDLTERVQAWSRPVDEPLVHLLREPRRLRATLRDDLWLRPVDVAAALGSRAYAVAGRLVLEIRDPFCPWNDGRVAVEAVAGGERGGAGRTTEEPDLVCTVNEVGAAFLGGTSFRQLHRAGRVEERSPGALARADAMFGWDPAPWCPYPF
ncbi:MAG TPA: GNAT family N-acetyltransferase [Actinomycetota bacterium]